MADEQQALEEFTRKIQEAGGATDGMIKNLKDAENSLGNFAKKSVADVAKGVQKKELQKETKNHMIVKDQRIYFV